MRYAIILMMAAAPALADFDKEQYQSCKAECKIKAEIPDAPPQPVCTGRATESLRSDYTKQDYMAFGKATVSAKFVTTKSKDLAGQIALVPATGQGSIGRRVWLSDCPNGEPLAQSIKGRNRCERSGSQVQLQWTQSSDRMACELERNHAYYLNFRNVNCKVGSCGMYRSMGNNGR